MSRRVFRRNSVQCAKFGPFDNYSMTWSKWIKCYTLKVGAFDKPKHLIEASYVRVFFPGFVLHVRVNYRSDSTREKTPGDFQKGSKDPRIGNLVGKSSYFFYYYHLSLWLIYNFYTRIIVADVRRLSARKWMIKKTSFQLTVESNPALICQMQSVRLFCPPTSWRITHRN